SGRSRCCGAEERAPLGIRLAVALRRCCRNARLDRGYGAAPCLAAPEQRFPHGVQKSPRSVGARGPAAPDRPDAGIPGPEGLVLHEHGLHQRIDGMGRAGEPFGNGPLGLRIARLIFEPSQAIEQIGDELTFLRGHAPLLWNGLSQDMGARPPQGNARQTSVTPAVARARGKSSPEKYWYSLSRKSVSGSRRRSSSSTWPGWHMRTPPSGSPSRNRGNSAAKSVEGSRS